MIVICEWSLWNPRWSNLNPNQLYEYYYFLGEWCKVNPNIFDRHVAASIHFSVAWILIWKNTHGFTDVTDMQLLFGVDLPMKERYIGYWKR